MANHNIVPSYESQPTPEVNQEFVERIFPDFRRTDAQFSLARHEYGKQIGADLVNPQDGTRVYVVQGSSEAAEKMIKEQLGKAVLPTSKLVHPSFLRDASEVKIQTYEIPFGARPVKRTLEQSPYREMYMERLAQRVGELLGGLRKLDSGLFGATVDAVAVGHNGKSYEDDDTNLFLMPPLKTPGQASPATYETMLGTASGLSKQVETALRAGFEKGTSHEN